MKFRFLVFLFSLSHSVSVKAREILHRQTLASLYTAPTCSHRQSCLFSVDDLRFEMCSCGSDQKCNGDYSATHQGMLYTFCTDPELPLCSDGDLSVTVEGLQTTLHCTCPPPLVERKISNGYDKSDFICESEQEFTSRSPKMFKLLRGWKIRSEKVKKQKASSSRRRILNDVRCQGKNSEC